MFRRKPSAPRQKSVSPLFDAVARWIGKSLQRRGTFGTALFPLQLAYRIVRDRISPGIRRQIARREAAGRQFDLLHQVDTSGYIPLCRLEIDSQNWRYGRRYQAIDPAGFRAALEAGGDIVSNRAFVDLGCGKGRAILLAAEYAFDRIVGVEFSPQLVEVAQKNLLTYTNPLQVCRKIEVVLDDAAMYPLPEAPLVLFLFNPFGPEVMAKVVENVCGSIHQHPRLVTVIYCNAKQDHLWAAAAPLKKAVSTRAFSIYHLR